MIPRQLQNNGNRFCLVKANEKAPFEKNWQNGGYSWDDTKLKDWIKRGGNAGILTGDGIVVFDCDCQQAENIARQLPETMVVGTSIIQDNGTQFRKKHFYFKSDLKQKHILKDYDKHLGEIQASGQQCLIPPSIHPSGTKYEILEDRNISEVKKDSLLKTISPFMTDSKKDPVSVKDLSDGTGMGNRNESMIRLATFHRKAGASIEEALTLLVEQNKKNVPPLLESELRTIAESAYRPAEPYKYFFDEDPAEYDDPSQFFSGATFVPKRLSEKIMEKYAFKTIEDTESIYFYKNGVYRPGGDRLIKSECRKWLGEKSTKTRVSEVVFFIMISTYIRREDIPIGIVNFQNGVYNINTRTFENHSPDIFSMAQLPFDYDPDADCPTVKNFISEIVDEDDVPMIQEIFGYCLFKSQMFQKAFLFHGNKMAGKSTLLRLLTEFLGEDNVSAIPLQKFQFSRFSVSELYGKLANISPDLGEQAMKDTGTFKQLTGEDRLEGERKYKDSFFFTNTAKMLFSCNKIPETKDHGDAYFRRWQIINFPNCFEGEDRDLELFDKLTDKQELSGVFNWALEGLERVLLNRKFTNESTVEETKALYLRKSSHIVEWLNDNVVEDPTGEIEKDELYSRFRRYSIDNGIPPMAKKGFTLQIQMLKPEVTTRKVKIGLKRPWVWVGLSWRSNDNSK